MVLLQRGHIIIEGGGIEREGGAGSHVIPRAIAFNANNQLRKEKILNAIALVIPEGLYPFSGFFRPC